MALFFYSAMKRLPVLKQRCFRCIREVYDGEVEEFMYECAWEVMKKMSQDEVNVLANDVLQYVREKYPYDNNSRLTVIVGDSYARIYLYTITHGGYLRDAYRYVREVRETLEKASMVSIPAWGVRSMYETGNVPVPQCWLDRICGKV